LAGVFILALWLTTQLNILANVSFDSAPSVVRNIHSSTLIPITMSIPKVSIKNLPIGETYIRNGIWTIDSQGASHLEDSARIDEEGNNIIYGHNTNNRLGNMQSIIVGNEIILTDTKGTQHPYIVREVKTVLPSDISYLNKMIGDQTLTLYTCTGFADSHRLVVKALPES
jgi:LPXTG-site transpeptidase (sortase) family protein